MKDWQIDTVHREYMRAEGTTRPLCALYALAYQQALSDLAHEFQRHDYYSEARKTRSFAETSEWQFKEEPTDDE